MEFQIGQRETVPLAKQREAGAVKLEQASQQADTRDY